jgi:hypothetical protein
LSVRVSPPGFMHRYERSCMQASFPAIGAMA